MKSCQLGVEAETKAHNRLLYVICSARTFWRFSCIRKQTGNDQLLAERMRRMDCLQNNGVSIIPQFRLRRVRVCPGRPFSLFPLPVIQAPSEISIQHRNLLEYFIQVCGTKIKSQAGRYFLSLFFYASIICLLSHPIPMRAATVFLLIRYGKTVTLLTTPATITGRSYFTSSRFQKRPSDLVSVPSGS